MASEVPVATPPPASAASANLESKEIWADSDMGIDEEVLTMSASDIRARTQMLTTNIRVMKSELHSIEEDIT